MTQQPVTIQQSVRTQQSAPQEYEMSAPTLEPAPVPSITVRVARVRFCDREDAEMFLEWLQLRSLSRGGGITFGLFMATAADAYAVSSALTGAVLEEVLPAELPDGVRDLVWGPAVPPAIGPFESGHGWEVMQVMTPPPYPRPDR